MSKARRGRNRLEILSISLIGLGVLFLIVGLVFHFVPRFDTLSAVLLILGGSLIGISAILGTFLQYKCPECGKGTLRPIASRSAGRAIDSEGQFRKVSQFYDCDYCGHRKWIEHD